MDAAEAERNKREDAEIRRAIDRKKNRKKRKIKIASASLELDKKAARWSFQN